MSCATEYIQQDVQLYYSTEAQSAINVPVIDGTQFACALVDAFPPMFPTAETVNDEDQVGDGAPFPRFVRLYRWGVTFSLGMRLNTEFALVLLTRALGGTIADALVETGVYDHSVKTQTRLQGRCPVLTTLIMPVSANGANFLFSDIAVNDFTISQTGDAQPTVQFNLMGSGYHIRPHGVVGLPNPDTQTPTYHYFHGAALSLKLNDGTLKDLSGAGRLLGYSVAYQNNIIVSRRVGDNMIVAGDVRTGSYAKNMTRGRQMCTVNFKQTLDDTLAEYNWLRTNQAIRGIVIKNIGDPIGAGSDYELEIDIPKGQLQSLTGSVDNTLLAVDDVMLALKDDLTGDYCNLRGRNGNAKLTGSSSPSPSSSRSPSASSSPSISPSASASPS